MGIFDGIMRIITKSGKDVAKNANDFVETSRVNSQIAGEQRALTAFYAQIGEKYFTLRGEAPEEEFAQACERIKAGLGRIAEMRERLQQMRNVRLCPRCGAECALTASFCAACGSRLPEPPAEAAAPAAEPGPTPEPAPTTAPEPEPAPSAAPESAPAPQDDTSV